MIGIYPTWQPIYASQGIATFPLRENKVPAIRNFLRVGMKGSGQLAAKFLECDTLGFATGPRSKITVLDIDTADENILADAIDRHGKTPVVVRTASGKWHVWYRHNGERRRIRPWRASSLPIDLLGVGGMVVAPPSKTQAGCYKIVQGSLDDVASLPIIRGIDPTLLGSALKVGQKLNQSFHEIQEGNRNSLLWQHCMREAHRCHTLEEMVDVARTFNERCNPPLPSEEIIKTAKSAWTKTTEGNNRFGRHGVFFDTDETNRMISVDQDAFVLLAFLRANNGPDRTFMIANPLSKKLNWTVKRLANARRTLTQTHLQQVRRPSRHLGPALYRWKNNGSRI